MHEEQPRDTCDFDSALQYMVPSALSEDTLLNLACSASDIGSDLQVEFQTVWARFGPTVAGWRGVGAHLLCSGLLLL